MKDIYYYYTSWDCFAIRKYEELYGKTPTRDELFAAQDQLPGLNLSEYFSLYETEYYRNDFSGSTIRNMTYLISDEDDIALSKRVGETHESITVSLKTNDMFYTVIHSTNPEVTEAWLAENFSHLESPLLSQSAIVTPDTVFDGIIKASMEQIRGNLIAIFVILAVMSVCMYFIMRSSLMSRIKEVGIYRAIGVSKKNLVFKRKPEKS